MRRDGLVAQRPERCVGAGGICIEGGDGHESFDAERVNRAIDDEAITIISLVATMLTRMLADRDDRRDFHVERGRAATQTPQ